MLMFISSSSRDWTADYFSDVETSYMAFFTGIPRISPVVAYVPPLVLRVSA